MASPEPQRDESGRALRDSLTLGVRFCCDITSRNQSATLSDPCVPALRADYAELVTLRAKGGGS